MYATYCKAADETLSYAHFFLAALHTAHYIAYVFCALDTRKYMVAQVYIWVLVNTSICMVQLTYKVKLAWRDPTSCARVACESLLSLQMLLLLSINAAIVNVAVSMCKCRSHCVQRLLLLLFVNIAVIVYKCRYWMLLLCVNVATATCKCWAGCHCVRQSSVVLDSIDSG